MFSRDLYLLCVDIMIFSYYISYMYAIITFMHGVTNTKKSVILDSTQLKELLIFLLRNPP
jgi:hypothetical protein